jgi:hypothetical protein
MTTRYTVKTPKGAARVAIVVYGRTGGEPWRFQMAMREALRRWYGKNARVCICNRADREPDTCLEWLLAHRRAHGGTLRQAWRAWLNRRKTL